MKKKIEKSTRFTLLPSGEGGALAPDEGLITVTISESLSGAKILIRPVGHLLPMGEGRNFNLRLYEPAEEERAPKTSV